MLNVKRDLIGKTIKGVVAAPNRSGNEMTVDGSPAPEIWMLQFSDGTHIEFVSPGARQGLRKWTGSGGPQRRNESPQLMLNVA